MKDSTMKISDTTKIELAKIGGELTAKDGRQRSMEEVVLHLIAAYRKR
jgi:hypothetical protein